MLEIVKRIILDSQEMHWEHGVPRRLDLKYLPGKASVCVGVRRCGKSTYLFQLMHRLLREGVTRQNILYVDFFDDRLHDLQHGSPGIVTDAYYSIYPQKKDKETVHCFLDEIQVAPGWETFVARLLRTERVSVTLTGSSANLLSREIASQMRGRALTWELFPFSFREFLDGEGVKCDPPFSSREQLIVSKVFEKFWETGGFPEVRNLDQHLRFRVHQEYFHALLYRDLIERHDISHPRALLDLAHRLITNTASLYSINRLAGFLKSLGHKIPKTSVSDYLQWFEDAYFLFSVPIYSASVTKRKKNPRKIYCIDHSLAVSVGSGILLNSGHLLENLVFTALRRNFQNIFYYRTRSGKEVDFVLPNPGAPPLLIQVCESMAGNATWKRELGALSEAMAELHTERGLVITRNSTYEQTSHAQGIRIIAAWRFLLDIESLARQS